MKSNQAQIDAAKLELSYTRILAPISGKTGLRKVDAGNLVQANSAEGLVSITQSAPIFVVFSIPESQLQSLRLAVQDQQKQQKKLVVEAWDRSDKQLLATGELTTLDNQIDPATGTLKLKAQFANSDDSLFPNQFVNVRLNIAEQAGAVTIPQDAVQYGADGTYIYVVENNKAQLKMLELGVVDNGQVEVRKGLTAGDQIVMEGPRPVKTRSRRDSGAKQQAGLSHATVQTFYFASRCHVVTDAGAADRRFAWLAATASGGAAAGGLSDHSGV